MAKNEAKIRFTAETGTFNSAIKKSNESMSQLRAELKLNETQMKSTGATVEGLEQKHQILTNQLEASEAKTQALAQKVDLAAQTFGENSTEVSKLRTQLLNAQTAEEKIRQAISTCNSELEQQRSAARDAGEAQESLADTISSQQNDLNRLKSKYAELVAQHGKNSAEARSLANEIDSLSGDLKENQYAMARAEKAADELDNTMGDVGDSAQEAGDGFTVFKGMLADLASSGVQAALGGIKDLVTGFLELSENTRETRTAFAKLEASFDAAGLEADYAYDTIYGLQGVLGDTDKATEAANLMAKIATNEQDLDAYTRILTGTFALYGESIPTEGLMEGISATAAMGEVQGVLADALEWQGINLEDFNKKLGTMNSEEERSALIKETLTELYGEAADAYRENNDTLIEANEAQLRYNEALASLGEKSEPITTGLKNGFSNILHEVGALADSADFEAIGAAIESSLVYFGQEVLPEIVTGIQNFATGLKDAKTWAEENSAILIGFASVVGIVAVAIGAYNVVNGIKAAMDAAQVTTVWGLVAAHLAQAAAAMAAIAPYILIVAAIAAVIAIIVLCVKYWDEIVAAVKKCVAAIGEALGSFVEWLNSSVIQPMLSWFSDLWANIQGIYGNVKGWFTEKFNAAKEGVLNAWSSVVSKFQSIKDKVVSAFANVRAKISEPFEQARDAVKGVVDKIKGFFSGLKLELPKIKLPHFSISGSFSLSPPSVPKLSIDWYKDGGIFTKPTIFGTPYGLKGVGEAGAEAVLPIDKLEGYVAGAIQKTMNVVNLGALANAIEDLANRPVEVKINDRAFAVATAGATDSVNGLRTTFQNRGMVL